MRSLIALAAVALAGLAAAQALPDLSLEEFDRIPPAFDLRTFSPDDCELQPSDACVGGPGARLLLRFSVFVANRGAADLVLGVPSDDDPMFVYSPCHDHFHFDTFARYELQSADGSQLVMPGQKRSFCVEDTRSAGSKAARKYCCDSSCDNVQGIQRDWGDLYPAILPCQWIDITDVAPGDYRLCVDVNFAEIISEADFSNNHACVQVHVGAADPAYAPRVKVRRPRRNQRVHAGKGLRVKWRTKLREGDGLFQELWFSRDGGQTFELVTNDLGTRRHGYRWTVPEGVVTDHARVKVVVGSRNPPKALGIEALHRAEAVSRPFRVVP